jgi:hypothetical protein
MKWIATCVIAAAACGSDAPPPPSDAGDEPDPLAITVQPPAGSLDDLHQRIISERCSGQPGLCHNGQFEPNLSTPADMYAYVVNRPGIEKSDRLRVKPGDPSASLLVDKLRNRNGVATQMPLGAEPLEESDIAAVEAWITAGALRAPGADPAPTLDNPPKRPEIAIFNNSGTRLDGTGPVQVTAGSATLVLRHSVQDFETPDNMIPFAAVVLQLADGKDIVLAPGNAQSPQIGPTTFDASGPQGITDQLDFKLTWVVPATLDVFDPNTNQRSTRPAAGQTVTVIALYIDGATPPIVALDFSSTSIELK